MSLVVELALAPGDPEIWGHDDVLEPVELVAVSVVVVVSVVDSKLELDDVAPSEPELSVELLVVTTGVVSAARR